jgi:hypothetical protein
MEGSSASVVSRRNSPLERFHATHSYWAVLIAIIAGFLFAGLAPDAAWATSVLVLVETGTLVLALRTSGWRVAESRVVLVLVVIGVSAATANLVWRGNALLTVLDVLTGLLTLALGIVIAIGAVKQGEVNSKSVAGAICVYVLIGMFFLYLYGAIAVLGHGPFFAQGTDGTRAIRLYFSYVTLATLGYGDYTPAGNLGHSLAILEALFGQLYLVTVLALLVSRLQGRRADRDDP